MVITNVSVQFISLFSADLEQDWQSYLTYPVNPYWRRYFQHAYKPLDTISGCGKREAHINWSMVMQKAAPVAGTTLRTTGPVPADSRQ